MKVLYSVILYSYNLYDSPTINSLQSSGVLLDDIKVHDNSKLNYKLSIVYNEAIKYASSEGYDVVVLLDEDTEINLSFITSIKDYKNYDLLIPKLIDGEKLISPMRMHKLARFCMSGVALRSSFFKSFNFDERFSIYGIDDYLNVQSTYNSRNLVFSDVVLSHHLSTSQGLNGLNTHSPSRLHELLRGNFLNFRLSPFYLKFYFFKKVFIYSLALIFKLEFKLLVKSFIVNKAKLIGG